MTTSRSILLLSVALCGLSGLAQAQQTTENVDQPPPFCEVLPDPKSTVTVNDTSVTALVLGMGCPGSTSSLAGVPYALNFQVTEDATAQEILVEMSPRNLVQPVVENGRLSLVANLEGASIRDPG